MNALNKLVGAPGFEPITYRVKAGCSEPIELCPLQFCDVIWFLLHDVLVKKLLAQSVS